MKFAIYTPVPNFRSANPEQRENLVMLENLMAEQIPLLEVMIALYVQ